MKSLLITLLFSWFITYFVNISEFIHQNGDTYNFLFVYTCIYSLVCFFIIKNYNVIHQKLIKKIFLLVISLILFCISICLMIYTMNNVNSIYEEFLEDSNTLTTKEQRAIKNLQIKNLYELNNKILFASLLFCFLLNLSLDFLQARKEKAKKNIYISLFFLNLGFYLFLILAGLFLLILLFIPRFFAGFG